MSEIASHHTVDETTRGGGPGDRPAPRATTTGAGRLRRRRSCQRVVLIAPDLPAAHRYLGDRAASGAEVLVITGPASLVTLERVRLRRRDRVEWLRGWSAGSRGRDLAVAVECAAATGLFGHARHVFGVDA